ncbi:CDP-diacylglycerol--glycerol-3-phosphate 3-phosphatidyltransferase [Ceratobasidium sp. 394]|nr:CDP-diacylglycerol--glycerol-3-phosphate 3-phosphatidyltransferase [Ceratobasidium sp. 394]
MLCRPQLWRLAVSRWSPLRDRKAHFAPIHSGVERRSDPSSLLTESMTGILPKFEVEAKNVSVLASPSEFYNKILAMIANARKRIHISSLYIGETETKLVAALSDALAKNGELELVIQVDALRSTRPSKAQISPVHLLLPLIGAYPDRVKVHLFRSPKLNGLLRHLVPRRFDEGWGTWHAKVYLVDDEVLLSGANLSTSYFTDRQDRYVHIKSASLFTSYLVELLRVFSEYSWRLRPTPDISLGYALDWFRRDSSIFNFANLARKDVARLQESTRAKTSLVHPAERAVIFPMVQSGVLGIREEEQSLAQLFDLIESGGPFHGTLVDLTSGYFALYGPYQDRVIGSNADYRIVAASPQANGFLGSKGLSGRIPAGYTLLERRFWNRVLAAHRQWENGKGIELSEWECPGWTYHAKGIWYSSSVFEAPYATLFGSTNLNSRSAHLDTEISFLLSVPERENSLRAALRHEVANIRRNANHVDSNTFALAERQVSPVTKAIVGLVGSML